MIGYKYSMFLINPYIYGAGGASYPVDDYSPDVAYSVRKISSTATNCLRVRRSSDSTEQDIGFSGDAIDTASMESFCGVGDGFVVKWYDQAGTNHLTMSTAANQPKIVSAGITMTGTNGFSAMQFDGTNDHFTLTSNINTTTDNTDVLVFDRASSGIHSVGFGNTTSTPYLTYWLNSDVTYWKPAAAAGQIIEAANTGTGDWLIFTVQTGGTAYHWKNNVAKLTPSYGWTASGNTLTVFGRRSTGYHNGYFQEVMLFSTDETSNRTAIQDNINTYYSIY